jgi:hypothetical protein
LKEVLSNVTQESGGGDDFPWLKRPLFSFHCFPEQMKENARPISEWDFASPFLYPAAA